MSHERKLSVWLSANLEKGMSITVVKLKLRIVIRNTYLDLS